LLLDIGGTYGRSKMVVRLFRIFTEST
jgi:hypothetical protein